MKKNIYQQLKLFSFWWKDTIIFVLLQHWKHHWCCSSPPTNVRVSWTWQWTMLWPSISGTIDV